jgi:hypothetical protein
LLNYVEDRRIMPVILTFWVTPAIAEIRTDFHRGIRGTKSAFLASDKAYYLLQ